MGNTPEMHAGLARMIDANLNRATEGLRVADDLARFVLKSAPLCAEFKTIRHGVVAAAAPLGATVGGIEHRDTPGDVGTTVSTQGEMNRPSLASAAEAACGRAQEAVRVLEESAKVAGFGEAARSLEALRYRTYTAARTLILKLKRSACPQWRLCVLVTESLCVHMPWERVVEAAIAGGADCLQLREKTLEGGELLRRATRLVEIARGRAAVIINDRPDVAALSEADGVHLGQSDLPIAAARRIVGERSWIGVSTANLDQARRAAAEGADYVGLGPMYPSGTKPKDTLAGVEYLRAYLSGGAAGASERLPLPHLAISGITTANIDQLRAAGCQGVAVSSSVCGAPNPKAACEALLV
jgi:thiamine-phosphate pyrophosphorylase